MLMEVGMIAEVVLKAGKALLENFGGTIAEELATTVLERLRSGSALVQDQARAAELKGNPALLRQFREAQASLAAVQQEQNALKREELALAARSGALELAITQKLGEAQLDLGWRTLEQRGQIEEAKLQQQRHRFGSRARVCRCSSGNTRKAWSSSAKPNRSKTIGRGNPPVVAPVLCHPPGCECWLNRVQD